jgi:hypothetical protein
MYLRAWVCMSLQSLPVFVLAPTSCRNPTPAVRSRPLLIEVGVCVLRELAAVGAEQHSGFPKYGQSPDSCPIWHAARGGAQ